MGNLFPVTRLELHIRKINASDSAATAHLRFSTYVQHLAIECGDRRHRAHYEVTLQEAASGAICASAYE
jgi:hypothetical protein